MQDLQNSGVVDKIGYSIYDPAELDLLWSDFQPDIIQAPYNILDRRLKTSGWLQQLHDANVEVHVRSVFLQGLLLMKKERRPNKFERWNHLWNRWDQWLDVNKISALEACLGFVISEMAIDRVVVGVDSLAQLDEILSLSTTSIPQVPHDLVTSDLDLINPSNWSSL